MPPRRAFLSRQAGDQTSSIVTPASKIQNPVIRRHYETLLDPVHGGPTIRSGKLIPTAFAAHEQCRDGYRLRCITGEQLHFDEQTGRLVSSWRFELVQSVKPRRARPNTSSIGRPLAPIRVGPLDSIFLGRALACQKQRCNCTESLLSPPRTWEDCLCFELTARLR